MPTIVHDFSWPDRVVVGTVGQPGSREFYLQVRSRAKIISISLEKQQSAVLAEKIDEILDELSSREGSAISIPADTPVELVDNDPLEQPLDTQFRTGTMSLGWDPSTAQVVLEAYPFMDEDDAFDEQDAFSDDPDAGPAEVLRVRMPVGTARAFAKRTLEVVGSGRPLCPLCGTPMDPEGHVCPLPGDLG